MGDVITIAVNLERKGFEKGCAELRGAITSLSQTAKKMADGMKSVIPSIIGVGSAFGIITKAANTFMQQNVMLTRQMEAVWTALGNLIGPIVEQLVSWVVTAVSYLISFLNLLGITSKTASQLSKQAQGSASALQKTVAGFDELNVLQDTRQGSLPDLDPKEWMSELSELLKAGQFAEAGRHLAAQLNEMVANIDWVGIGDKLANGFKAAVDFLGNFIRGFDVHSLGRYVADMVNRILNVDTSGEDTWRNLGEILVAKFTLVFDFLTGFLEELDTTALAKAVSGIIIGALEAITDSIATADWKKIGENINAFFATIDWEGIFTAVCDLISAAFSGLNDFLAGLFGGSSETGINWQGIGETIRSKISEIDWASIFTSICEGIGGVFAGVGEFLHGLLGDTLDSMMETLMENTELCGGDIVAGLLLGIVNALVNIGTWIYDNIFKPFMNGFNNAFEIHSPSVIMENAGGLVIEGLLQGLKSAWDSVQAWLTETIASFVEKWQETEDFFRDLWENVVSFATDAWTKIGTLATNCVSGLQNGWSNFRTFILNMWTGIVSGVKGAINSIIGCVNGMISAVVSGVNAVSSTLNRIKIDIPSWVPGIGGATLGFNLPTFSAPQIPYLAEGGVLKKGQVGLLEGSGAEAVVPLERNTEWINKMADAFMARVQAGSYDLTGNAKTIAALEAIADRVTYRVPTVAAGEILPYSVSSQADGGGSFDSAGVYELLQSISDKLDRLDQLEELVFLLANMQFVADFGDNIRALARKITKEQRRAQISEGR